MPGRHLEDRIDSIEGLLATFRATDVGGADSHWQVYEDEYTHWMEEQRAWQESCILMDQSYHLANYYFEGPDALTVNADLGVSDVQTMASPAARQHPVCNPDGYIIGDPVLFHLAEDEVVVVGNKGIAQRWIHYCVESGEYDAEVTDIYSPYRDSPPLDFRFEVQGPNARDVLEAVVDGSVPALPTFGMETVSILDVEVYLLAHGMASAPGFELFGPYEYHDAVKDRLLEAGREYGIRRLGSKAYKTATLTTGWLPTGLPAVYDHPQMADYRRWVPADAVEANWSLGGSFRADDITDYYLNPVELGYDHLIDMTHEFVGKEAIARRLGTPERKKVTLVWNSEDLLAVFGSLFEEGPTHKFVDLPDLVQPWALGHYDRVRRNGEDIGVAMLSGYDANHRAMLSLGVLDIDSATPGTDVTVVWGEADSPKSTVECHEETGIRATVAPAPYGTDRDASERR